MSRTKFNAVDLTPGRSPIMPSTMKSFDTINRESNLARWGAAAIAVLGWVGLIVQFNATYGLTGSVVESLWTLVRYFTVLTNLLTAVVMTGIAVGYPTFKSPAVLGGSTFFIATVGILYSLLLRGLLELSGGAKLADFILHDAIPILAVLYWLVFAQKGLLKARDPWIWLIYPLLYAIYALIRGAADGKYAYPQINAAQIGWPQTAINVAAILAGFLVMGYILCGLDRQLGRRPTKS